MQIIEKDIKELKPYEKNPRKNDDAVDAVMKSIRQCGYISPIIVDENDIVLAGHTRLKALKNLGMETVEVGVAEGLTEEQKQKFRLLDNRVAEESKWDFELLAEELEGLDFGDLELDWNLPDNPDGEPDNNDGYFGDARENTYNQYNLHEYDENRTDGFYQMPVIRKVDYVPSELIGFNYMITSKEYEKGIHFYVDDYQFERIWNQPQLYIEKMKRFNCCLAPDFSLYLDMPMAMKIWNVYRSRLIGQMCQDAGMIVIPTLSWAEEETFSFCFDGLEQGGTVSVSTIGVKRDEDAIKIWVSGMDAAMERLKPKTVLVYGGDIGYDFGDVKVVYYKNGVTERMRESGENRS